MEKQLHGKLRSHRVIGEWFEDCADVRSAILSLTFGSVLEDPETAAHVAAALDWAILILDEHDPDDVRTEIAALRDMARARADGVLVDDLAGLLGQPSISDVVEFFVAVASAKPSAEE